MIGSRKRGKSLTNRSYYIIIEIKKIVRIYPYYISNAQLTSFIILEAVLEIKKKKKRSHIGTLHPLSPNVYEVNCAQHAIEVDFVVISMHLK